MAFIIKRPCAKCGTIKSVRSLTYTPINGSNPAFVCRPCYEVIEIGYAARYRSGLSFNQTRLILRCSPHTLTKFVKEGLLVPRRGVTGRYYFNPVEVDSFLKKREAAWTARQKR